MELGEVRTRRRLCWFLAGFVVLLFVLFAVHALWHGQWAKAWPGYVRGLGLSTVVVNLAWLRMLCSRCPRCAHWFFAGGRLSDPGTWRPFAAACVHCGLPLDAESDKARGD